MRNKDKKQKQYTGLIRLSPHFQRAINLKYDLGNVEYIAGYIPTPNASKALSTLLGSTISESSQHADLLYGPYGSGKSLFAAVLAAILSNDEALQTALPPVLNRLRRDFPETAEAIASQISSGLRLLPVVLSGDEGDLSLALGRALDRTLTELNLKDIQPHTVYRAALEVIHQWRSDYPATYDHLADWLREQGETREDLTRALEQYQSWAYQLFLDAYPHLTAGAVFNRHNGQSIVEVYRQTARELRNYGYAGIAIIWDEFGRFLEARVGEPAGADAALLQDFAEACNRSRANQVHLILIAHKELGQYASHLPVEYQQEWRRIAGRFRLMDISGDPNISYRLIAEALSVVDPTAWEEFLKTQQTTMDRLLERTFELGIFQLLPPANIRDIVLEGAYPLHPLATYCLPHLSNRIAQNERTLFTFLASQDPNSLRSHLLHAQLGTASAWVRLDRVWDYFARAIRADIGSGGAHQVWVSVEAALQRVAPDDTLSVQLIKTLGVLSVVGNPDGVRSNTETLSFAVGLEDPDGRHAVEERLKHLTRRKVLIFNQIEGIWEFFSGSSVDLEAILNEAQETRVLRPNQRRQLLERILPPHHCRARRFNQEHGMTRFFWSLYRAPQEMAEIDWDKALRTMRVNGHHWEYVDGLIVYILPTDEAELTEAHKRARTICHPQVLVVVPRRPLLISRPLSDWLTLDELAHDARFKEQDPDRLQRELDFYLAETVNRLRQALSPLVQSAVAGADWYYQTEILDSSPRSAAQISRLLSSICDAVFPHTPRLSNELLNKREPSSVQMRAVNKVIDALFTDQLTNDLGLSGNGPDMMALTTILKIPGIFRETDSGEWKLGRPTDKKLALAWDEIEHFLHQAQEAPQSFNELFHILQSPPYGLRLGILPLLIAAVTRGYLRVATFRRGQKVISPLTGAVFTDLCRRPDQYTVEVETWDPRLEILWQILEEEKRFDGLVLAEERRCQPLNYLSLGMLRWLQSQPRYSRDTTHISEKAARLRDLIRQASVEPAKVLFEELLELLDDDIDQSDYRDVLKRNLDRLLNELSTATYELERRLDKFTIEHFAADSPTSLQRGQAALSYWLKGVQQRVGTRFETLRFGDERAVGLVRAIQSNGEAKLPFWDQLSQSLIGISLGDWNDQSEEVFRSMLLEAQQLVERESLGLANEGETVHLRIHVPDKGEQTYRFRPASLSPQGHRILQNFEATLEIAGRPLSSDEKRQIVLALLHHVLGDEDV
jgi:hypothetical protein